MTMQLSLLDIMEGEDDPETDRLPAPPLALPLPSEPPKTAPETAPERSGLYGFFPPDKVGAYDLNGNTAALSFVHALKVAGYRDRVTTGGEVDLVKLRRACNALTPGRVASDRPQPSADDYLAAARFVKEQSEEGFAEIPKLELLAPDTATTSSPETTRK